MSVKPNFSELTLKSGKSLKSQSIVESRIAEKDSDIVKIIAVGASASVIGSETVASEVRYSGRVIFSLVYVNSENAVIRSEYGVEFSHKAEREDILASMRAEVFLSAENTELKQLNGSFVLSAIITADIILSGSIVYKYIDGGEGLVSRTEDAQIYKNTGAASGGYEFFEELECKGINDILTHFETVTLTDVQPGIGCIICDGVVNLNIVYTYGENNSIGCLTKLSDFRFEVACDEAMPNMKGKACVFVKGAKLSVAVDEAKDISRIAYEVALEAVAELYEEVTVCFASDVYSTSNELNIAAEGIKCEYPLMSKSFTEKVSGTAITGSEINFSTDIEGITQESLNIQTTEISLGRITAEGVVTALALTKSSEGQIGSVGLELPFAIELSLDGVTQGSGVDISGLAFNVTARQKKEGEIEMEATLKLFAAVTESNILTVISDVEEGDEIIKKCCAISVFMPEKGDGLWDVAKRLKEAPEDILSYNEDLQFPLTGDEKIIIYRRENIEY